MKARPRISKPAELWTCPRCRRHFRQVHQRHSCGAGSVEDLLKRKPEPLVKLFRDLEKTLKGLGGVEIVARDRYALFRTSRIFADLVFMKDALRLMVLLDRQVEREPLFFKVQRHERRVAHVARLRNRAELRAVAPYLKEAHRFSMRERPRP